MIQISFALALIAIVFGAKLLAQSKKDGLGAMYKYLAWFVIAMGFLILLCDCAQTMRRCMMHREDGRMMRQECMMRDGGCNEHGMMGGGQCPMMMNHCHHGNIGCMNNSGCCNGGMMNCCGNNNCSDPAMMNCPDGGNSSCKGGMPADCPMMKDKHSKSDTTSDKK